MNYLNKALDVFDTSVVTPILYVIFTSFVIIASAVLFKEWGSLGAVDIVGNLCGFLTTVSGVFLLQTFKDLDLASLVQLSGKVAKADIEGAVVVNDKVQGKGYYSQTPQRK